MLLSPVKEQRCEPHIFLVQNFEISSNLLEYLGCLKVIRLSFIGFMRDIDPWLTRAVLINAVEGCGEYKVLKYSSRTAILTYVGIYRVN